MADETKGGNRVAEPGLIHVEPVDTPSDSEAYGRLPFGFQAPPHNLEAEQALLGAIMVNDSTLADAAEFLKPEHFYEPVHQSIFEVMLKTHQDGLLVDHVTLASAFETDERLAQVNGSRYLAGLAQAAITILNTQDYARLIFDLAQRRALAAICQEGLNAAMDPSLTVASEWKGIAHRITSSIEDISITEPHDRSWDGMTVINHLKERLLESSPKVSTGYACLDAALGGGLRPGCIYGFDAPPKSNKTSVLSGVQRGALISGVKTHFFSLEQSPTDLVAREFCGDTNTPLAWLEDKANADLAVARLDAWAVTNPYFEHAKFDHVPGITIDDLLIRMNRSMIDHGTRVFFIDYYTKIAGKAQRQNEAAFYEQVAQKLSAFIQSNDLILVIALQQNREGKNLWSDGIKRECSWLATIHKVEVGLRGGKSKAEIWFEVTDARYGPAENVGSDDERLLVIVRGPAVREIKER